MDIPPDVQIKGAIQPGTVYYFPDEELTSDKPHYFIVINIDPYSEEVILLVVSSSQIEKVKRRRKNESTETLVEISQEQYQEFPYSSIVDCNNVFVKDIDIIIEKYKNNELARKTEMSTEIVEKIRKGVLSSNQITKEIKDRLRE